MWRKALFFFLILFILSPWGSPAVALAAGLIFALTFGSPYPKLSGKTATYLLQTCVVLLGFGMNLEAVYKAGRQGIFFIISVVFGALALGFLLARFLRTSKKVTTLISTGTAICGGSAIAAVGPAINAENDEMSISLGTIFMLNAVALFAFPIIGHLTELSEPQFGLWAAVAIQDTSSVVGASSAYGPEALAVAATVKLARALWIAPLALVWAFVFHEKGAKAKIKIPWFIFLFVGAAAFRTFAPASILPSIYESLVNLAKAGFTVTLFLIGLGLSKEMLKRVGWRPFALGMILWVVIATCTLLAVINLS